jgi:RTX calcium-binding nonapeptide repeat (4 copies)
MATSCPETVTAVVGCVDRPSEEHACAASRAGQPATIVGTSGDDVLDGTPGHPGADLLCGGAGADRLAFVCHGIERISAPG